MSTNTHVELDWAVEPRVVRPVIRELVLIIGLVIGIQLGYLLPGTNQPLFDTTVTGDDVILGVGTIGLITSLIHGAPHCKRLVTNVIQGPSDIQDNAGRIGYALVLFIAVLVAHSGLALLVSPVVAVPWLYDLVFLVIALVPLGIIVYRFRDILEPLSTALTNRVVPAPSDSDIGLNTTATEMEEHS